LKNNTTGAVTIHYLEMRNKNAVQLKARSPGFKVTLLDPPQWQINRKFYVEVGAPWRWTDRLDCHDHDWQQYAERNDLETWIGYWQDEEIGYFELEKQQNNTVQIAYFGLVPAFIGKGFGGQLLGAAIECAWNIPGTQRLWVHTCTHDHANALNNYLERGFGLFKTESHD
jgi:GNAT superfamily N-acetyltransferase